ncbi:hypothetical protein [Psychrobacter sp. CAL346-MNA-CIBAN-0220]
MDNNFSHVHIMLNNWQVILGKKKPITKDWLFKFEQLPINGGDEET